MADFQDRVRRAGQAGRPPTQPGLGAGLVRRGRRRRAARRGAGAVVGLVLLGGIGLGVVSTDPTPTPVVTGAVEPAPGPRRPAQDATGDGPVDQPVDGVVRDGGSGPASAGAPPGAPPAGGGPDRAPGPAAGSGGTAPEDDGTNDGATDTGVTATTVTISTLYVGTGPVPDATGDVRDAMEAFAAYAQRDLGPIHGRTIEVQLHDTQLDPARARQEARRACEESFAIVGSYVTPDESQAVESVTQAADCPDLRAILPEDGSPEQAGDWTWRLRQDDPLEPALGPWSTWARRGAEAVATAAWVAPEAVPGSSSPGPLGGVLTDTASTGQAHEDWIAAVQEATTAELDYDWSIDFRHARGDSSWYGRLAQDFRDQDIQFTRIESEPLDTVRFVQKLREVGHWPRFVTLSPDLYLDAVAAQGGPDLEGAQIALDHLPWFERTANPVLDRYLSWLDRVHPGQEPTRPGLLAWSAAERLVEDLRAMGPAPTREWLAERWNAVAAWDASGALAPDGFRGSIGVECAAVITTDGQRWLRHLGRPGSFTCP